MWSFPDVITSCSGLPGSIFNQIGTGLARSIVHLRPNGFRGELGDSNRFCEPKLPFMSSATQPISLGCSGGGEINDSKVGQLMSDAQCADHPLGKATEYHTCGIVSTSWSQMSMAANELQVERRREWGDLSSTETAPKSDLILCYKH